jgi:hypothetical protein
MQRLTSTWMVANTVNPAIARLFLIRREIYLLLQCRQHMIIGMHEPS